jgi:hypothetical protein
LPLYPLDQRKRKGSVMGKFLSIVCMAIAVLGLAITAGAAVQNERVHGTIASVASNNLKVDSGNGKTIDLTTGSDTKYAWVVPSSLSDIKAGDFVGIGATGSDSQPAAREVTIFPESMRGTGEGHYGWSVPAAGARADRNETGRDEPPGAPPVQGTMTNGTVTGATPQTQSAPPVQGTMTNGTVASKGAQGGGQDVTVSYSNGQHIQIHVPPNAPVVRLVPTDRSALQSGSKLFAVASRSGNSDSLKANFIAVGKDGLTPPM